MTDERINRYIDDKQITMIFIFHKLLCQFFLSEMDCKCKFLGLSR